LKVYSCGLIIGAIFLFGISHFLRVDVATRIQSILPILLGKAGLSAIAIIIIGTFSGPKTESDKNSQT
jgi:hypothetical protein